MNLHLDGGEKRLITHTHTVICMVRSLDRVPIPLKKQINSKEQHIIIVALSTIAQYEKSLKPHLC